MSHSSSTWQDHPGIHRVDLNKLSPMSDRKDVPWFWCDFPKIMDDGMSYPLLYYKVSPQWWNTKFKGYFGSSHWIWHNINPPAICEDGLIWALRRGSSKLKCLKFMGYTSADAILFDNVDKLLELDRQFKKTATLHGGKHGNSI